MCKKNYNFMKYKDRFPICISFVINIVLAVIFICFVGGYFESNDDSGMSFIVEGIYGEKSAHLVFINIIIGKILKILYTLVPLVKWYVVFQYTGIFFSFTFLSYLLLKNSLNIKRLLLVLIILVPFSYECYVSLQFTKTAGVLTATGFFGLFYVLKQSEKKRLYLISALLALTGSMLRFQSFLIVSAVMCIIGVFVLIEINKGAEKNIKVFYNNTKRYFWGFGIIFLLIFTFFIGDRMVYTNDNGWEYFLKYNNARYKLLDYGFPDWDTNKTEYQKMGYTLEDIQMYSAWTFADFDKLSLDDMEEILKLNHTKKISINMIVNYLKDFPHRMIKMPLVSIVLLIFLYYMLFCKEKKWYVLCYLLLIEIGCYFYFCYKGRYENINRIDVVFLYAIICTITFLICWSSERDIKREKVVLSFMGIACIGSIVYFSQIISPKDSDIDPYTYWAFYDLLQADSSKLYLENTASIFHTNAYGMWDVIPVGLSQNRYSLGNWLTGSPTTNDILKTYDIQNPFKEAIDNENVYLIDNYNIDMELSYIRRNYEDQAKVALVKNINGFMIYKIYTEIESSYGEHLIEESKNIVSNINVDYLPKEKRIDVSGNLYKKNINSYQQEFYIDIYNKDRKNHNLIPITQFQSEEEDLYNGKYGRVEQSFSTEDLEFGTYDIRILLHADQENYLAKKKEITVSNNLKE